MKKWIKRVLISLMAVLLALGLIPFSARAAGEYDVELHDVSFGNIVEGYKSSDYGENIMADYTGTSSIIASNCKIVLTAGDKTAFRCTSLVGGSGSPGRTYKVGRVYPVENLSPGTYTATATYYYDIDGESGTQYGWEALDTATITMTIVPRTNPHSITIQNGTADKSSAAKGEIVNIIANDAPTGKVFEHWEVVSGNVTIENPKMTHTRFVMPDTAVVVKAVYVTKIVSADLKDLDLGDADPGYDYSDYHKFLYFENTGTGPMKIMDCNVALTGGNTSAFTVSLLQGGSVMPGSTVSVANVKPVAGLSSGTYTAVLTLYYENQAIDTATVRFVVNQNGKHLVTVINGTSDKTQAAKGERVKITADTPPTGQVFYKWDVVAGDITLDDETATVTRFTMPNTSVKVRALYKDQKYQVSFDPCQGTMPNSEKTQMVTSGQTANRPSDPIAVNAFFNNWYTESVHVYDFSRPVRNDINLYARYTVMLHAETYDQATETPKSGGKITYHYDIVCDEFTEEMFTDDYMLLSAEADPGYNFVEWKIGYGSDSFSVSECETYSKLDYIQVTPYEHTTLYAVFEKIPTSAYSLSETSITVNTMSAHMLYLFAYGQKSDGIWSSSNPSVATVDNDGFVTGVSCGKCTIHVSSPDGTFQADCAVEVLFWDVKEPSSYYFKAVYWAAYHKPYVITKGYENGKYFGRGFPCTREDFILFIWRLAGQPKVSDSDVAAMESKFSDASALSSNNFRKAVAWGVKNKIINGYTSGPNAGKFGVGLTVERKDALIMLYRYAGKPKWSFTSARPESGFNFTDVIGIYPKKSDTYNAIAWGYVNKITNGYSTTNPPPSDYEYPLPCFGSTVPCQREQMIVFLYRYDNLK